MKEEARKGPCGTQGKLKKKFDLGDVTNKKTGVRAGGERVKIFIGCDQNEPD